MSSQTMAAFFVPSSHQPNTHRKETILMIKLIAAYSKKIGLPGYSSHSFAVSMETELNDVENVAGESERLYALLQQSVDSQIQQTGFVPPDGYGMNNSGQHTSNGNGGQQRP